MAADASGFARPPRKSPPALRALASENPPEASGHGPFGADASFDQHSLYRSLIESALDTITFIAILDQAGICRYISQSVENVLGYRPEERIGQRSIESVHPDDVREVADKLTAIFTNPGLTQSSTFRFRHADGSWRMIESIGNGFRTGDGEVWAVVNSRDVTQRTQAEEALRASEHRYQLAMTAGQIGIWDWDLQTNHVHLDHTLRRLLGYDEEVARHHFDDWWALVYPDDGEAVMRQLRDCVNGDKGSIDLEHRMMHRDGSIRWFLARGTVLRNEEGDPVRLLGTEMDITEGRTIQQALRQSNARYQDLYDNAPDMYFTIDGRGVVVAVNRFGAESLGYAVGHLKGRPLWDVMHPDDVPAVHGRAGEIFAHRSDGELECRVVRRNGQVRWVHLRVHFVNSEAGGDLRVVGRDVTEWKLAEEELRRTRNELEIRVAERTAELSRINAELSKQNTERTLAQQALRRSLSLQQATLESTADGILVVDMDGRIVSWNKKFAAMWRIPDDVLQREEDGAALEFVLDQLKDPEAFLARVRELYEHPGESSSDLLPFKDGRIFERYSQPQRIENRIVGRVWSFRDITEQTRAIEALEHSQKLESLGVLAGGIAHDFNNLLVGVLGNAGLALAELPADSSARARVEAIEKSAVRAAELTDQLLAYAGKTTFSPEPVQLNALIDDTKSLLDSSVSKKTSIEFDLAEDVPLIQGGPTQIRQVIMNLAINASEALDDTQGTVTIRTRYRHLDATEAVARYPSGLVGDVADGWYAALEVGDGGCGMPADTVAKIFDPFYTTKFTGRGLGLAAVLGIVRSHGGVIGVATEKGEGTTVTVLFPAAEPEAIAAKAPGWKARGLILVVDDEPMVLEVAEGMLSRLGFSTVCANDGREGINLFRDRAREIDAVLLDMTMPYANGDEVTQAIHALRPETPIVLMSGYTEEDAAKRFADSGLAAFLHKPFRLETLTSTLQQVMEMNVGSR